MVIDPDSYSGRTFHDRLAALAESISSQEGARLPGAGRRPSDPVDVEDSVWTLVTELAGD